MEERQTLEWPSDKRIYNDKQNITQTTKDRATRTPTDYGSERICIVCWRTKKYLAKRISE